MKTCKKCGVYMKDTNRYTLYCKDCERKFVKGPLPPVQEEKVSMIQ